MVLRSKEIELLLSTERQHELSTQRVLGYPVWGIERYAWHERNLAAGVAETPTSAAAPAAAPAAPKPETGAPETAKPETGAPQTAKPTGASGAQALLERNTRIRASLQDLRSLPQLRQRDIWVLSSSQYRRTNRAGEARCLFTGYLEQALGERLLFLERNRAGLPANPQDNVVFLDSVMEGLAAAASQSAKLLAPLIPRAALQQFAPISAQRLAKSAVLGHLWDAVAELLIATLRPRAVFVLCGYTRFVPLQRVLKRKGIPLIEMQHGIIHSAHGGYTFDAQRAPDYAPDHCLVFGPRFGEILERCSEYWRGRWSVGGHPWLAELVRATSATPGDEPVAQQSVAAPAAAAANKPVLVFSQPLLPVKRQLQQFLPEFRRLLPPEIEIVLKPHPREPEAAQDYRAALDAGVRLESSGADSYRMLAQCRTSVTVFSTLALEALAFPCQSVVLRSPLWPQEIQQFVADGVLLAAATPAELVRHVCNPEPAGSAQDLAAELFGVGLPQLDFEQLLRDVQRH